MQHPLSAWLAERRISRREAARQFEIDPSYISHIVSGARRPSLGLAIRMSRITGIPIEELFPPQTREGEAAPGATSPGGNVSN